MNEQEIADAQKLIDSVTQGTGTLEPCKPVFPSLPHFEEWREVHRIATEMWRRGPNDAKTLILRMEEIVSISARVIGSAPALTPKPANEAPEGK